MCCCVSGRALSDVDGKSTVYLVGYIDGSTLNSVVTTRQLRELCGIAEIYLFFFTILSSHGSHSTFE